MKINYERLEELLQKVSKSIILENDTFIDTRDDNEILLYLTNEVEIDDFVNELMSDEKPLLYRRAIYLFIIEYLRPYRDEILEREINKEKLINVFKKYAGWEVEDNYLLISQNTRNSTLQYNLDSLVEAYIDNDYDFPGYGVDVVLSFMRHYKGEFTE